jgi:O-antigen ligase
MIGMTQASMMRHSLAILPLGALAGIAITPFYPEGAMAASICMMVLGLGALVSGCWRWNKDDNPVATVNATFAIYALGSAAISLSRGDHISQLEQYLPFLGAALLGIGFRLTRLTIGRIGTAFAAGATAAAIFCLWQTATAEGVHRAEILVFSTWLGTAGALYAVVCGALAKWSEGTGVNRRTLLVGSGCGALVALLSGSKGSWLVLAACAPVLALARGIGPGWKRGGWAIAAGAGFVAIGTLLPNSPVVPRIKEAMEIGGDRLRSAYWREAVALFERSPLLGSGREAVREKLLGVSLAVRDGVPLDEAPNDAHNEYLDILAARGAAGLLLTLSALAVPFAVFWRLRSSPAARTGLMFIFAFALAGLTDVQFAVNMKRMLYLFTVLFLLVAATDDPKTDGDSLP